MKVGWVLDWIADELGRESGTFVCLIASQGKEGYGSKRCSY